jgi:hypothetical protein
LPLAVFVSAIRGYSLKNRPHSNYRQNTEGKNLPLAILFRPPAVPQIIARLIQTAASTEVLAVLSRPPETLAKEPLASFKLPPNTEEELPLAVFFGRQQQMLLASFKLPPDTDCHWHYCLGHETAR